MDTDQEPSRPGWPRGPGPGRAGSPEPDSPRPRPESPLHSVTTFLDLVLIPLIPSDPAQFLPLPRHHDQQSVPAASEPAPGAASVPTGPRRFPSPLTLLGRYWMIAEVGPASPPTRIAERCARFAPFAINLPMEASDIWPFGGKRGPISKLPLPCR
jgi:hypothetical protein